MVFDSILSPLAPFADVWLEVKETEVFGFRGLVLSVLICLSLSLIVELGKQMDQHKKEIV
jgi:DNA-binding MurR/RpiR family transcriptional regulator